MLFQTVTVYAKDSITINYIHIIVKYTNSRGLIEGLKGVTDPTWYYCNCYIATSTELLSTYPILSLFIMYYMSVSQLHTTFTYLQY